MVASLVATGIVVVIVQEIVLPYVAEYVPLSFEPWFTAKVLVTALALFIANTLFASLR